jgi:ATP-binding cassette subfamily C protein
VDQGRKRRGDPATVNPVSAYDDNTAEVVAADAQSAGQLKLDPAGAVPSQETAKGTASRSRKPAPPALQRRTVDADFREVLTRGLASCRRNLVTVAIFSFVINLLILVIPVYLFQVSDRVLTSRSSETLVMLSLVVIGAIAIHAVLDIFRRLLMMRVATQVESTLGAPVLSAATKSAQQGSTRDFQALSDLQHVRNFLTGPTLLSVFDAPVAPVYFLAVYLVHWQLGLIITTSALLLSVIAMVNRRMTAMPFAKMGGYQTRANQQVEAMARNAAIVNAMGMINEGVMLWGRETAESLKANVVAQDRNVLLSGITKFVRLSTQVGMLGWGAKLALSGEVTGGMMIAASIIGSRALAPVEALIEGWRNVIQARTSYARIQTLLQSSPLNLERLVLPRPQGQLHVDRVLYVPPPTKKVILNGVNFSLEPGESLAIVGPSGTGKSTLAKMLVGSIAPTSGSIRLDLMDIRNWNPRQFGETIGYLPQDVELFPATIKANIARMREDITDVEIFDAAELTGVHQMIAQMPQGYETMIGLDGSPLSGGQKQRIGLARAFFGKPRLVVLDEPNSNLDSAGESALGNAFVQAKREGITVVAVTQRPSLLRSVDKIMLLNEGRVQVFGKRDDVLAKLASAKGPDLELTA